MVVCKLMLVMNYKHFDLFRPVGTCACHLIGNKNRWARKLMDHVTRVRPREAKNTDSRCQMRFTDTDCLSLFPKAGSFLQMCQIMESKSSKKREIPLPFSKLFTPFTKVRTLVKNLHNPTGAPNVNLRQISVRKTIWDLEFSEHLLQNFLLACLS